MPDTLTTLPAIVPPGEVIARGHPDYDAARALYNAMIDKKPRWIVRCATAREVANAIAFARESGLPLAVRGGGHNGAGLGSCDDGLFLAFAPMTPARPPRAARLGGVGAGARGGEVTGVPRHYGL